jgi:hypothetical protein
LLDSVYGYGILTVEVLVGATTKILTKKATDKLVEAAYYATCSGIQIDIMDIGKVFKVGAAAVQRGERDEALGATVRAYVETIRKN